MMNSWWSKKILRTTKKYLQEKKLNSIEEENDDESKVIKEDFKNDKERSSRKETKFNWRGKWWWIQGDQRRI